jgi:outer membrane protein
MKTLGTAWGAYSIAARAIAVRVAALIVCATVPAPVLAQEAARWSQQAWGLGFTFRTANIPFATPEKTVTTLIPLIMYEGRRFYIREIEAGVKILDRNRWRLSAMGRAHFFDMPREYQNEIQGDRMDWGAQFRYKARPDVWFDLEYLVDRDGNQSGHARVTDRWATGRFRMDGFADAAYRSARYNTYFWGLRREQVGAGFDFGAGINAYLHVASSLYLQGAVAATWLNGPARDASLVEDDYQWRAFLGFGLSNDRRQTMDRPLEIPGYWRLAHHWATPSSLAKIIRFQAEPDPLGSQLTSLFWGLPLTDRIFGAPVAVYLHSGVGLHWSSPYQSTELEGILSIKLVYTVDLPWRIRIGMAEGVSFVSDVPARERENLEAKGYQPSEYLNYLDPSVDLSLGDVFGWEALEDVWLGYVIHHRSAIFETAQQFGRIKGGSNYQGVYLQISR